MEGTAGEEHGGGGGDEWDFGGWGGCGGVPDFACAGEGWNAAGEAAGHVGFGYPKAVRAAVLRAMDAEAISVAEMARLNWRLGEVYADAVEKAAGAAWGEGRVGGVPWADGVSPGRGGEVFGEGAAGYVADG